MSTERLATIITPVHGKYTHWKKGQVVKATRSRNGTYVIERLRWRGSLVALTNSCAGVPASKLHFHTR
jgi:hypothetical protein